MLAVSERGKPRKAQRRPRRQSYSLADVKGIDARVMEYRGRIVAMQNAMMKDGIRSIEFDGAGAIERAFTELDHWVKLASLEILKARMDRGHQPPLD